MMRNIIAGALFSLLFTAAPAAAQELQIAIAPCAYTACTVTSISANAGSTVAEGFTMTGRVGVGIPVVVFTPTASSGASNAAIDCYPHGTAANFNGTTTGDCWLDLVDRDISVSGTNFVTTRLQIFTDGHSDLSNTSGGTGTAAGLSLQGVHSGKVTVGGPNNTNPILSFINRVDLNAPGAGIFALFNATDTGFTRLDFGGLTSAFGALQTNGTETDSELADGSALAPFGASVYFSRGTIPTVTGTGTPTIATGSTNTAGEVTAGATATSVVITFSGSPLANAPFCTVSPQTILLVFSYTISTSAITITQTATSGDKIDYVCFQH